MIVPFPLTSVRTRILLEMGNKVHKIIKTILGFDWEKERRNAPIFRWMPGGTHASEELSYYLSRLSRLNSSKWH